MLSGVETIGTGWSGCQLYARAESTLGPQCCGNENSNRTLDLAACSAVPQSSALSRSPDRYVEIETYVISTALHAVVSSYCTTYSSR
jgi:hypothetical protein